MSHTLGTHEGYTYSKDHPLHGEDGGLLLMVDRHLPLSTDKEGYPSHDIVYMPLKDINSTRWFLLYVMVIIDTILYNDKNHEYFHIGLILVVQGICSQGERYAWAPCILAQLYQNFHSFVSMKKGEG